MILDDLAARLSSVVSGPVTTAHMPDAPDTITVVSEYPLGAPDAHDTTRYLGISVRCRALTYDAARTACHAAYTSLHKLAETQGTTTYVHSILAQQEPYPLAYDGKRWTFACNLRALID